MWIASSSLLAAAGSGGLAPPAADSLRAAVEHAHGGHPWVGGQLRRQPAAAGLTSHGNLRRVEPSAELARGLRILLHRPIDRLPHVIDRRSAGARGVRVYGDGGRRRRIAGAAHRGFSCGPTSSAGSSSRPAEITRKPWLAISVRKVRNRLPACMHAPLPQDDRKRARGLEIGGVVDHVLGKAGVGGHDRLERPTAERRLRRKVWRHAKRSGRPSASLPSTQHRRRRERRLRACARSLPAGSPGGSTPAYSVSPCVRLSFHCISAEVYLSARRSGSS